MSAHQPLSISQLIADRVTAWLGKATTFGAFMQCVGLLSALVHTTFLLVFWWAGVNSMALFNVGSVLVHVVVFYIARRGRSQLAFVIAGTEVAAHGMAATLVLGWNSGFHYYLLLILPVAVFSGRTSWLFKSSVVAGTACSYLALNLYTRHTPPWHVVSTPVLDGLQYGNALNLMASLTILASFYYYLIQQSEAALRLIATTDPLTQLRNRRALMDAMREQDTPGPAAQLTLAVILGDLDHFKRINDEYGHDTGDHVLKEVSRLLARGARGSDHLSRWGGEEFLIALPGSDAATAMQVAERLRTAVQDLRIETVNALDGQRVALAVSMTFGVAVRAAGETTEQAISRADKALYEGKRQGRNQVVLARESEHAAARVACMPEPASTEAC